MKGESIKMKGLWKCKQCTKEFRYESDMRRHELSHVPQFECKRCCKKFTYLSALRRHEKTHERSGRVHCSQCDGHFRDDMLLKRHMRYSHKGIYKCDKCTATFSSELALRTHKKTHKPESERRFRCSFGCGKSFNFSHHLKHHEMTHTNTKQHFCQTCGKGFIQSHHLKTHEKSHEPKHWLPCPVSDCKKKFVDEYARKRHLAIHRNTHNTGSSSDSSVAIKISPSKDSQDGELQLSLRKPSISSGRKFFLTCKSIQEREILNSAFIDYENKDVENDRLLEEKVINVRDIDLDNRDNDFVDEVIKTCKTAIGSCLVELDSKLDQSCLCAQMTYQTGETGNEFVPAPYVETLKVNEKEMFNKSHESICLLHGPIHDSNINDFTAMRSPVKRNGEARRSRKQPIAIHSSDRHIIVECNDEKVVEVNKSNRRFMNHEHKDSQDNNTKANFAVYGRDDNTDDTESNIGSCLVTRDLDEYENDIRISRSSKEIVLKSNNEIIDVKNCNVEVSTVNSDVSLQDFEISSYERVLSKCDGCECANMCSIRDKIACKRETPNVECIPGGIVKLKNTFDFDFQASASIGDKVKNVNDNDEINSNIVDCKSSNFKSCKDVIGNCIVSGNSTMGEGCLCARMMIDDQAMAEEIDEITPCPQGTV